VGSENPSRSEGEDVNRVARTPK